MFGHVTLDEHRGLLGLEADGEQHRGQGDGGVAQHTGPIGDGERVQVDDAMEGVAFVLTRHPVPQRPEVIAQVDVAGGLDAGQHSGHGGQRYRLAVVRRG